MGSDPIAIEIIHGYEHALPRFTRRGDVPEPELPKHIQTKNREIFGRDLSAREAVDEIVARVKVEGDPAVRQYTMAFDGSAPDRVEVPPEQWESAWNALDSSLREALTTATQRVRSFHEKQQRTAWFETEDLGIYGQVVRPLSRVGVYTPAGSAALPSSLIMTAVPARVAGVDEIVVCSPPSRDGTVAPIILAAAKAAEVDRVFAIGGAQAIAAMAYGTETVPQVDKILGPGNIFVALAKQRVYGTVAIDQIAGPTETLIMADQTADAELVAADLLAQAEHDTIAQAMLVTTSETLAGQVVAALPEQADAIDRGDIARTSLSQNSLIVVVDTREEMLAIANAYAPEHLCLLVNDPWSLIPDVKNAGGIFVGEDSPEALGDYTAGPSHVMPTGGTARFSSPIHLADFQKVITLAAGNWDAIETLGPATIELANAEGLQGHAAAIRRRLNRRS